MQQFLSYFLLGLIKVYRLAISPLLGQNCRFYPSCSAYAMDVIKHHGPFRGVWLVFCRLMRCHPFHKGGNDPPPPPSKRR